MYALIFFYFIIIFFFLALAISPVYFIPVTILTIGLIMLSCSSKEERNG